jgi:hypothetical protein
VAAKKRRRAPRKRVIPRRTELLIRLGALLIIVMILVNRGCFARPTANYPGSHFNRGANAAWLSVDWVNGPHPAEDVAGLAEDLVRRQIGTVYVYASYRQPDGSFNPSYGYASTFVRDLKAYAPDLVVQAWVGLPLEYVDLSNQDVREEIAAFGAKLVGMGFDGVHLDPEPVRDGDAEVLALLEATREALGEGPVLSMATRRIWPLFPKVRWPGVGRWFWSTRYYRQVARRCDEVAAMVYDSALPLPALYRYWVKFEVIALSRAIVGTDARLYVGVPTSQEATRTHRPRAETPKAGLQGVVNGLNDLASRPATVTGVAIYPYWEADAATWDVYGEVWLGE